jgi:hypothetical protein
MSTAALKSITPWMDFLNEISRWLSYPSRSPESPHGVMRLHSSPGHAQEAKPKPGGLAYAYGGQRAAAAARPPPAP